jgi:hypothetical protein
VAISVVGGIAASAINGGNPSLVLTGMGVAQDDVVLVFGGIGGSAAGTQGASGNTSGAFQQLVSSDSGANQFYVGWQRMGATPDTTITCNGNGDSGDGAAYACIVLRGVTTASPPTDATTTTATPTTSTNPDPPQIDWSTAGTAVIVGALSVVNDAAITIPSGYSTTNMASFTATANDGEDASVAIAYDLTPADPENPGTFTGWASGLWQAATVAIKEAITASFGDGALSGGSISGTATFVSAATDAKAVSMTGTGTASLTGASTAVAKLFATGGCDNDELLLNDGASFVLLNDATTTLALNSGSPVFVGSADKNTVLSATGTGTATFVSAAEDAKAFSMTGTWTASFTGESTADSVLSATGTGTASLVGASDADGVLSATGTGTAAFEGASEAAPSEGALAATGTVTATFAGDYDAFNCGLVLNDGTSFVLLSDASSVLLLNDDSCTAEPSPYSTAVLSATGSGEALFIGESTAESALSATGTWTATFVGASEAESALAATGTGTASLVGAADSDTVLSATGTGTATLIGASSADSPFSMTGAGTAAFIGESFADSILAATGTVTVSWDYAQEGEGALNATATGDAVLIGASDADAVLAATGTGTADFIGEGVQAETDAVFEATGTGTASFVGAFDSVAQPETPAATGGGAGGFPGAWKARKKRKKKDALDELDELLVAVSEQIAPWSAAKAYEAEQALYRSVLERGKQLDMDDTLARIEAEIVNIKELLAEMDDEEALLLLM